MNDPLVELAGTVQASLYFAVIVTVGLAESLVPRRAASLPIEQRWIGNLAVGALGFGLARLTMPVLGVAAAMAASEQGVGLLPSLDLSLWVAAPLAFLLLDLSRYARHWLFHHVPVLWAMHRLHHADPDIDLTTSFRTHPLEAVAMIGMDLGLIVLLGIPPVALLAHHLLHTVLSVTDHGNFTIPLPVDRRLRWVLVTPDMHRVHHSSLASETDSNYSTVLAFWDRLFGTYRDQPLGGHEKMGVGLLEYRNPKFLSIGRMLADPFRGLRPAGSLAVCASIRLAVEAFSALRTGMPSGGTRAQRKSAERSSA